MGGHFFTITFRPVACFNSSNHSSFFLLKEGKQKNIITCLHAARILLLMLPCPFSYQVLLAISNWLRVLLFILAAYEIVCEWLVHCQNMIAFPGSFAVVLCYGIAITKICNINFGLQSSCFHSFACARVFPCVVFLLSFWLLLSPNALLHMYFILTGAQIPEVSLLLPNYLLLSCTWEGTVHPEEMSGTFPKSSQTNSSEDSCAKL